MAGFEQTPVAGEHVPTSWQTSSAPQGLGSEPAHAPEAQASVRVHAFPSLHSVPSGTTGFEHAPVAGAHVPAWWHASIAKHTTGFEPEQTPS